MSGNSQGLTNDALILSEALNEIYGESTYIRHFSGSASKLKNATLLMRLLVDKYLLRNRQITFHLEEIYQEVAPFSDENIFIPNQEWLRSGTLQAITPNIHIWCKTRYAVERLSHLTNNIHYVGFCSRDMYDGAIEKKPNSFIHIAGKSEQKGTQAILNIWQKNPQWPTVTILSRNPAHKAYQSENIDIIDKFVAEDELKRLMNSHQIHLCPSESEGFGHNIVEALSTGALLMVTDAPPMNELVPKDANYFIKVKSKSERYLSELFYVDEEDFSDKVNNILSCNDELGKSISKTNKLHYHHLKTSFGSALTTQKVFTPTNKLTDNTGEQ